MKGLLLPLLAALALPTAVNAEVSDEVHQSCLKATDYLGCVKAQTGGVKAQPDKLVANSCPPSFAYVGAGQCRKFRCFDMGKEVPMLYRKHVCEKPPIRLGFERWRLVWSVEIGNKTASAIHSPFCPNREPGLGWGSTCDEERGLLPEKVSKKKNKLPTACRTGVWDENHPKCQLKEETITSPMDMD